MAKEYNESGENLNFKICPSYLNFIDSIGTLNYSLDISKLSISESLQYLNFLVKTYDDTWILYKVLLDFIENFSVGDVFTDATNNNNINNLNGTFKSNINLKFRDVSEQLNFVIKSIIFKYSSYTEETLYDDLKTTVYFNENTENMFIETDLQIIDYKYSSDSNLKYIDLAEILNFKLIFDKMIFTESYQNLNFTVRDYDDTWILYKVLLDFIENFSVGDVFND